MKKRPSRAFTISLVVMLGAGGAGAWAWQRVDALSDYERAGRSFFAALQYSFEKPEQYPRVELPTEEQRQHTKAETDRVMAQLEAEFPALAVIEHPVTEHPLPAEENGFLQLYILSGKKSSYVVGKKLAPEDSLFGPDFSRVLDDSAPWDPAVARKFLADEAETVAKIEKIAAMKSRSTAGMPAEFIGYISPRVTKQAAEVLLLKARLAAEEKDQERAIHYVEAAANIGQHLHAIEKPTLLCETVRILIDMRTQERALKYLLPALGKDADLARWKTVLTRTGYTPEDFATLIRGEWQNTSRYYLLPLVLDERKSDHPKDGDKLARVFANSFNDFVVRLPKMSLREMISEPGLERLPSDTPNLSRKSRSILDTLFIGSRAYARGYVRAASTISRNQAALDLLILEKSGTPLEVATMQKVTRDPLTGEPFTFDPAKRTIVLPASKMLGGSVEVDTITLPW